MCQKLAAFEFAFATSNCAMIDTGDSKLSLFIIKNKNKISLLRGGHAVFCIGRNWFGESERAFFWCGHATNFLYWAYLPGLKLLIIEIATEPPPPS